MRQGPIILVTGAALLGGCASTLEREAYSPDYAPIVGEVAPPQGRRIADCVGQAASGGTYRRARDPSTELLMFTCTGAPARALYAGLAARSAAVDSEFRHDGRTYRSANRVRADLFGVDHCSTDDAGDHLCVMFLNVGDFLKE